MNDNNQVHSPLIPQESAKLISPKVLTALVVGMIVVGITSGFGLSRVFVPSQRVAGAETTPSMIKTETEAGVTDTKTFADTATGSLEKGGLNGEGTHKLVRQGGPSQTVYLISSIVDLDEFLGKTVEVAGQTLKAQKAPWLMDVGRVKIVQ